MPTYDYVCDGCGHAFELFQSMTEATKKTCPKCGKKKLRRLIGAGGAIMFKGSGCYKSDYRSDAYKKSAQADSSSGKGSSGGDSSSGGKKSGGDSASGPKKSGGDSGSS